jgi:hypothetical protein
VDESINSRPSADVTPHSTEAPDRGPDGRASGLDGRRMREHLVALVLFTGLSLLLLGPWILSRMSTWLLSVQPQDGSILAGRYGLLVPARGRVLRGHAERLRPAAAQASWARAR